MVVVVDFVVVVVGFVFVEVVVVVVDEVVVVVVVEGVWKPDAIVVVGSPQISGGGVPEMYSSVWTISGF